MRLLLVEDNEELAQLLSPHLQAAGYEADLLATVADALTAVMTTRYAAMVLDLGLPDGDGLAVLREMRQREDPLPVLVLTARGGLQDRVSGLRSGADDYLVKPFAFEELIARLEALLRRPGCRRRRTCRRDLFRRAPSYWIACLQEADHEARSDRHRAACHNWPSITGIRSWRFAPLGPRLEFSAHQWPARRGS
jgi:DNA-binding response OmpR family regulator